MTLFADEDMLQLSGIQHYVFCPRQWALIHLEQQWTDNRLTAEGTMLHANVDNPALRQTNGSPVITLRGLRLASPRMGITGIADAVELHPQPDAPSSKKALLKSKRYTLLPVEYKRGRPKPTDCDRLQVVAQAVILEEMLGVRAHGGAIFYWETRHREYFDITDAMRQELQHIITDMHSIMATGVIPPARKTSSCRSCSLIDICMPRLSSRSASTYLTTLLDEETP